MVYEFIGFVIEARSLGRRNAEDGSGWIFKGRMGQHITNHIAVALKALLISVHNRPGARRSTAGGLPRAPDGTGRLAVVRPVLPKGRTAVFGWTAGDGASDLS